MPLPPSIVTLTTDFGGGGALRRGDEGGDPAGCARRSAGRRQPRDRPAGRATRGRSSWVARGRGFRSGRSTWPWSTRGWGRERRLIAASVAGHWFVLPDNGLIGLVARGRTIDGLWSLAWPDDRPVSRTFHGRDLLAPAAAHLARGDDPADLGPPCDPRSLVSLDWPEPVAMGDDEIGGEVIFRDHYGNLVTNVPAAQLIGPGWGLEIARPSDPEPRRHLRRPARRDDRRP